MTDQSVDRLIKRLRKSPRHFYAVIGSFNGGAENASMEIVSTRGWKTQVRKRPVQTARVEIASMENASTSPKVGKRRYGENCECKPSLQHV